MDLSKLNLSAYRLHGTNLSNADFRNAFLVGVTLDYVDCCFTDFTGADLRGADIRKAFVKLNLWAQIYEYHLAQLNFTLIVYFRCSYFSYQLCISSYKITPEQKNYLLELLLVFCLLVFLTRRDFKLFLGQTKIRKLSIPHVFLYKFPQIF